jgi:NAD(P)-dependent dehydrogenase (short-subunit alcohol dehydrogenase family)
MTAIDLQGRAALVTGGGTRVGAAIVRALVAEGAVPVIVDRDDAASRELGR